MESFSLIGGFVALILIGAGLAVGLFACVALAALTSVGIVSSSVLVGFWRRRTLAGVQVFFVQCGVLLGAPVGAVMAWVAWHVWPMISEEWPTLAAGVVGGTGGGLVIAWLASAAAGSIAKHAWPWLNARMTVWHRERA